MTTDETPNRRHHEFTARLVPHLLNYSINIKVWLLVIVLFAIVAEIIYQKTITERAITQSITANSAPEIIEPTTPTKTPTSEEKPFYLEKTEKTIQIDGTTYSVSNGTTERVIDISQNQPFILTQTPVKDETHNLYQITIQDVTHYKSPKEYWSKQSHYPDAKFINLGDKLLLIGSSAPTENNAGMPVFEATIVNVDNLQETVVFSDSMFDSNAYTSISSISTDERFAKLTIGWEFVFSQYLLDLQNGELISLGAVDAGYTDSESWLENGNLEYVINPDGLSNLFAGGHGFYYRVTYNPTTKTELSKTQFDAE